LSQPNPKKKVPVKKRPGTCGGFLSREMGGIRRNQRIKNNIKTQGTVAISVGIRKPKAKAI